MACTAGTGVAGVPGPEGTAHAQAAPAASAACTQWEIKTITPTKFGWTDVARFAALGIPAINFGPGDPALAHTREEHVSLTQIRQMTEVLRGFLA